MGKTFIPRSALSSCGANVYLRTILGVVYLILSRKAWLQLVDDSRENFSGAGLGIDVPLVIVEANVLSGARKTLIVDLAETLVRECKNKVKAAMMISLFE